MKPAKEMTNSELVEHVKKLHKAQVCYDFELLLATRIEQLNQQNRWIPVDEALPDNGETVLCRRVEGGMFGSKEIKPQVGTFRNGSFDCVFDWTRVTHWRRIDI